MISNISSAKSRLNIAVGLDPNQTKLILKDLYTELEALTNKVELLTNEIRKLSENRPRSNKDSGKSV